MFRFVLYTRRELLRLLASFIMGILLGAAVFMLTISRNLDRLHLENSSLKMELSTKEEQVQNLKKSIEEYRTWIIQDLIIEFKDDIDEHMSIAVEEEVRNLLHNIIGREIDSIDQELFYQTIDNRIIEINDKRYKLNLEALIIWEKTKLILNVIPLS